MPLADGATFAGYTIVRMLGSGGMGEVYLAQHPRLPRRDALKVLPASVSADNEYRQRFNREADIAATLWHPHIVGVHDRGDFEGQIWISMDYVEGTDAGRLLRERYPNGMPKAEVADDRDRRRRRAGLRASARPATPRRQTRQHPAGPSGVRRSANSVGGLRHRPLGERHQRADRHEHDGRHRVVRGTRAADGWAARRAGGSIRVGGHRFSPVDGCSAVSEFQPGGRHQPAPVRVSARDRRAAP